MSVADLRHVFIEDKMCLFVICLSYLRDRLTPKDDVKEGYDRSLNNVLSMSFLCYVLVYLVQYALI